MTPHDALADGRLTEAILIQEAAIAASPDDPAARRLMADLLAFGGQYEKAREQLHAVASDDQAWIETRVTLDGIVLADQQRSIEFRRPRFIPDPPPVHMAARWQAVEALRQSQPEEAVELVDKADEASPSIKGFLDGMEFQGLCDPDDRFHSVLEAFVDGEYAWIAWETVRKVVLAKADVLLDQLYRPATVTLTDRTTLEVHLPLLYPGSFREDEAYALGLETDHVCPDGGPTRCIGARIILVGELFEEVHLGDCRMIEIR